MKETTISMYRRQIRMKCYITSQDDVLSIMANRTRILVTHALHVLDKTDYIYVMPVTVDEDIIVEKAT